MNIAFEVDERAEDLLMCLPCEDDEVDETNDVPLVEEGGDEVVLEQLYNKYITR